MIRSIFVLYLLICSFSSFSQEAIIENGKSVQLVWPFDNSFIINEDYGSDGWQMICGHRCGLHRDSDVFALDWSRWPVSACGAVFNAPLSGKVIGTTLSNVHGYGMQVIIQSDQDSNYAFRLAHMQSVMVKRGDVLKVGDPIGHVGDTGNGGCHGHLVVYKNIYDQAEGPLYAGDTMRTFKRAIDFLYGGEFITTSQENKSHFAQVYSFQLRQEGIIVETFVVDENIVAKEERLRGKIVLKNVGDKTWEGIMGIDILEDEQYSYSSLLEAFQVDPIQISPGTTKRLEFDLPLSYYDAGDYFAHLIYMIPDSVSTPGIIRYSKTPMSAQRIKIISKEQCNRNEPNDSLHLAQPLSPFQLDAQSHSNILVDFISYLDDEKDIFVLNAVHNGVLRLSLLDSFAYDIEYKIGDTSEFQAAGTSKFQKTLLAGEQLFFKITGRPSCERPYQVKYEWAPSENIIWSFSHNESAVSKIDVLNELSLQWFITDAMGRVIYQMAPTKLEVGSYTYEAETAQLPNGLYTSILMIDGKVQESRKFVIVK